MEIKYAVFILTHGRPNSVKTYNTLRKSGYTGNIYLVIDSDDKKKQEYLSKYKSEVIIFDKKDYKGTFDIMDNFDNDKVIVFARNALYDIARKLNLDYFFEYEDDYSAFYHRYAKGNVLKSISITDMHLVFNHMIDFLNTTKIDTLAFVQGGDLIGGKDSLTSNNYKRKAMNTFVFKVNKDRKDDILFLGRMNDDVNTYLNYGKVGKLFFQTTNIQVCQELTQKNSGGNTEAYKMYGTYLKTFYSLMIEPSCCKIYQIGTSSKRIHHSIKWINAVPMIIKENHKKKLNGIL
jgi:hypothetical protein